MLFSSIKELNSLISKGMSNTYLKNTIEKKWYTHNFDFLSLKSSSLGQFWEVSTHADIIKFSNLFLELKNQRPGSSTVAFLLF